MHHTILKDILKTLALSLVLLMSLPLAAAESLPTEQQDKPIPQDEREEIRKLIDAHYEAWNKHDSKEMAALYAEDGDLRTPWNEIGKNRQEVEKVLRSEFTGRAKNAHIEKSIKSIRIIKPGIAFVDVESTINGMETQNEKKYAPLHHHVVYLLVKRDNKWQVLSGRPF